MSDERRLRPLPALLLSLTACMAAGAIGAAAIWSSLDSWYLTLIKPAWYPPEWVFRTVWTVLYVMMAVAAWRVWQRGIALHERPMRWFAGQLLLNALWPVIFFGLRSPGAAMVELLLLWAAVAATLRAFWRISRLAGALLVPYQAWLTIAAVLNLVMWRLNR